MAGITHPYLNVGLIQGGTNTNVVPGKVVLKLDRRMIPEENPTEVEATLRRVIAEAAATVPGITVDVKRMLLARALTPLPGNQPLVEARAEARRRRSSASPSPPRARRCTPTCACTASTASRR